MENQTQTVKPITPTRPLEVRLTIPHPPPGLELLWPEGRTQWRETQFHLNPPAGAPCDFWIAHSYTLPKDSALVNPENTLFINGEPPAKKRYSAAFYQQFHHVCDPDDRGQHPRIKIFSPCLGWLVGFDTNAGRILYGYDYLKALPRPQKQNAVAVVCSDTAKTPGQRKRLAFLAALKQRLGSRLIHFGKGFNPVGDKMEAIAPFRFQLVLENSVSNHYWTEKLSDAYLGWAFPLYCGCPNLGDYFPAESFQMLDLDDVETAVRLIQALLDEPTEPWLPALTEARNRILGVYHPFARCHNLAQELYQEGPKRTIVIRHHHAFRGWRGWLRRLRTSRVK